MQRIETGDAERLVADYLNGFPKRPRTYYGVPPERPESFCVVERTGGVWELGRGTPRLDIDCWGPSRRAAWELADLVREAVEAMPGQVENVFGASIESIYRNPDIDTGTPRYTVSVELTVC